jgi:predicted SnoaL-like aldol condensation-catalyzing enzyme
MRTLLNQKDFDAAAKYLDPRYTQHNPNAADGSSACSPTATT